MQLGRSVDKQLSTYLGLCSVADNNDRVSVNQQRPTTGHIDEECVWSFVLLSISASPFELGRNGRA